MYLTPVTISIFSERRFTYYIHISYTTKRYTQQRENKTHYVDMIDNARKNLESLI